MTMQELLPPGIYPIWSPYDSYEAAAALMKAFLEDGAARNPGIEIPVLEAQTPTVQETEDVNAPCCISSPGRSATGFADG